MLLNDHCYQEVVTPLITRNYLPRLELDLDEERDPVETFHHLGELPFTLLVVDTVLYLAAHLSKDRGKETREKTPRMITTGTPRLR